MSAAPYPIKTEDELVFSFVSEGPRGRIRKIVRFDLIGPGLYNLGFGDQLENSLDFDDFANTNNGDMKKVLATVISTIFLFFEKYPNQALYVEGSDSIRTRLYIRIANNYFDGFKETIAIYGGIKNSVPEKLSKDKNYDYLIIKKK
ncbi:MAG TPA: hypothetical protein ENJ95_21610 [Bacteroidetes bacterium]|nr:hypothetical protein [Bacteroidota bacterium]